MDNTVLAPLSTVGNKIGNGRNAQGQPVVSVVNVVAAPNRSAAVSADIGSVLRRRHKLTDEEEADFSVISQEDLLNLVGTVTDFVTLFLGFIAIISLAAGLISGVYPASRAASLNPIEALHFE